MYYLSQPLTGLLSKTSQLFSGRVTFLFLIVSVMTINLTDALACTCVGKDKQTTENSFEGSSIVIEGTVLSVSNYFYYDTIAEALYGHKIDSEKMQYYIKKYNIFKISINRKFKVTSNMPDTIYVITGKGGGDCGFEFEIGKDYIVYGENWREQRIIVEQKKRKQKKKVVQALSSDTFYTDICDFTQVSSESEIKKLQQLSE